MQQKRNLFESIKNEQKAKVGQFSSEISWREIRACCSKIAHPFPHRWHYHEFPWLDT